MHALPPYAAALVFGYLCGSIPFGIVLTRLAGAPGPSRHRLRQYRRHQCVAHRPQGAGGRDARSATCSRAPSRSCSPHTCLGHDFAIAAAVGAFLGHLFPVWLRFRGGKGVATYIGVLLGLAWPAAVVFCAIWLAIAALTRYSSLAALIASAATPAFLWWRGDIRDAPVFLLLSVLLWIMHRANIARLLGGTEGKIGASAKPGGG